MILKQKKKLKLEKLNINKLTNLRVVKGGGGGETGRGVLGDPPPPGR